MWLNALINATLCNATTHSRRNKHGNTANETEADYESICIHDLPTVVRILFALSNFSVPLLQTRSQNVITFAATGLNSLCEGSSQTQYTPLQN